MFASTALKVLATSSEAFKHATHVSHAGVVVSSGCGCGEEEAAFDRAEEADDGPTFGGMAPGLAD